MRDYSVTQQFRKTFTRMVPKPMVIVVVNRVQITRLLRKVNCDLVLASQSVSLKSFNQAPMHNIWLEQESVGCKVLAAAAQHSLIHNVPVIKRLELWNRRR